MTDDDDKRLQRVNLALANLDKKYGKGTIARLDDDPEPWEAIPTGIVSFDSALGIGGFPVGRIIELFGSEGGGKSTMALTTVASAQKSGHLAAFVDAEHALDPLYAKQIGVETENLLVSQPSSGEEALDVVDHLVKTGDIKVIVVDSVAALTPKAELDGDMGDQHVGLQARLMGQALRKLGGIVAESETLLIFINQLRDKVGVMFGSSTTTPGGRALKFYSSVRVQMTHIQRNVNKSTGEILGARIKAQIVKNKMAPPFKTVEFDISGNKGIDKNADLADTAVDLGYITKKGAWYARDGANIAHGRQQLVEMMDNDPGFRDQIYHEVVKGESDE